LAVLGIAFIVFTFYPPHLPVFQNPFANGYGTASFVGVRVLIYLRLKHNSKSKILKK